MHKLLFSLLFTLFCELTFAQNCSICPSGTTVQLTSPYPATATHLWTCTDGFTSTQQNPTFAPIADVTCSLTATESGCTATSQSIVDVCDCACNENACIAMNYNSSTECVTFANTGTPCSPLATETRQWRNLTSNPWANIPISNQVCDCDIRERVNTTATVSVVSGAFRLQINGLQNRCSTCSGSNMQIEFVFGVTGFNSTLFPGCAGTTDWYTITAANFATAGYVANAYVRYSTPYGVVVNYYRFTYNGGGLAAGNVTVQQVYRKSIYKTIYTQRTLTFTDGCPSVTCNNSLAIPQQPNDPCTHFVAYITTVNLGSPCSGAGLSASTINATGPLTYQWKYNGTNIAGQTSQFLCMVGRPNGTYCCVVSDGTCTEEICIIVQPSCTLAVSVTSAGNNLTANLTGCVGTPTYQWQRWNGTSWINVGTNSNTYNTGGLAGDYRVNVSCSGPPACSAIGYITFTPPCTADVTISVGTSNLTANVTGCGGTNITYVWERWNGTTWVTVQTVTTTSTSNIYTPTISGLYRVTITCNGCTDQTQTTFTMPNPCTGFSANITGTFTGLCVGNTYTFNRTITGGTGPFTQVWTINGLGAGTGTSLNFTPLAAGAVTIAITVTDANNCSYTDSQVVNVIVCCGITLSISPTSTSVCTNQDATFTVTATGGTAPYTYSWTYSVPSGPVIGAGTGNPKTFNFPTANTYTLVCTVTDAVGCQFSIFATMTVTNCTNCVCTPNLVLNGCVLNGSFTGAGCGNFTYQLQYSATGTGWSIAASGTASNGGTFSHTPTANGFYRLVIVSNGCTLQQTADVNVNCVVSCGCTAGTLTYNTSTCLLSWTNTCSGYLADLDRFNGASWVFVSQTNPFSPTQDGLYRVTYRKGGCPDVSSNTVLIDLLLDCNTNYGDWNGDGFTDYLPEQIHPDHGHYFGSPYNNMLSYTSASYCDHVATSSNWTIIWGDGSTNTTGTGYTPSVNHTYSANGTYKQEYDLTTTLGLCEQDSYVYPNGTGNAIPTMILDGNCGDGAYPVLFSRPSCGMVDIWIWYNVHGFGSFTTTPTYTSHTVKINGTSYTVPISFVQGPPQIYWTIENYNSNTPISIPLSSLNNNINTIEVEVTVNSTQILKNKGYFRIVCN